MADKQHLAILKQGVGAWNQWRKDNAYVPVDLTGARLAGEDLDGANMTGADLFEADLSEAHLSGADLSRAKLHRANLSKANLHRADLRGTKLSEAHLSRAELIGGNLSYANLYGADLCRANLSEAKLYRADLVGGNLSHADLSVADLTGTDLRWANLGGADLGGADVRGADLAWANLGGADLDRAYVGSTTFADLDLTTVKGLETVRHSGPSTIGIDTIYRSRGNIPEAFLRGCGVPDDFITFVRSLVANPIEYYSSFISYSSRNQDFAARLHADLQAKGVRCWFAPEDMKIGDKIWDRLDQSIRLHDKLLLILSAEAIGSDWVEDEVTAAFEEERKRGKTVLFPVRLDDTVMSTAEPWAAKVRQRHIGDFRRWKEHDEYQKGFGRLLRDLKAETKKMNP